MKKPSIDSRGKEGFVLTAALMLLLVGSLVVGGFLSVSRSAHPSTIRWRQYDECLLAAQCAMEKIKANLYDDFRAEHEFSRSWNDLDWVVANASRFGTNGTLGEIVGSGVMTGRDYLGARIESQVSNGSVVGVSAEERQVFVTNEVTATWGGVSRKIVEVVRYKLNRSSVFDHAYFINNFGWFYGVDCVVNGDIRSNFDVELRSRNLVLNGYSYAVGVNDINRPYQTWSWTTYKNNVNSSYFRPTYHVDQNQRNEDSVFELGYNDSDTFNHVSQLDMPYIGNLNDYKYYAQENDGTISVGGSVVVDNIYDGLGPSGVSGAADEGCLYLKGTLSDPIIIDGPVVVEGDVIIEGYYTGQGTIYAGRNIHIINSVEALDPSQWKQPDDADDFHTETLPDNLERDFLGLAAKGAVVLGDHRTLSSSQQYFRPPFTSSYPVSGTDADIGYVSYTSGGVSYFDGDYTAHSGWRCDSSNPANNISRKFYEPSISPDEFDSYSPSRNVDQIDAFIYNNHLTIGRLGSGAMINGGIICRDEALFPAGRIYMNWDPRVALDQDFIPFLPMELGPAETILWREAQL